jgi:hypothetical protein
MFKHMKLFVLALSLVAMLPAAPALAGHRPVTSEGKAWNHTVHRASMRAVRRSQPTFNSTAIVARPSNRVTYSPAFRSGR